MVSEITLVKGSGSEVFRCSSRGSRVQSPGSARPAGGSRSRSVKSPQARSPSPAGLGRRDFWSRSGIRVPAARRARKQPARVWQRGPAGEHAREAAHRPIPAQPRCPFNPENFLPPLGTPARAHWLSSARLDPSSLLSYWHSQASIPSLAS